MTREEAIQVLANFYVSTKNPKANHLCEAVYIAMQALKSEPVKHGQWLSVKVMDDEADFGEVDGAECSVCGYTTNSEYWAKTYYKFCPNCGARMDGGERKEREDYCEEHCKKPYINYFICKECRAERKDGGENE